MGAQPFKVLYLAQLEEARTEKEEPNLVRLGVDHDHAYQWSRTCMGGWAVAQSPILLTTVTLERLRKRGYEAMLAYYEKIAPHLNEPLCIRDPYVQWCERLSDRLLAYRLPTRLYAVFLSLVENSVRV